jgi:hypothetical protein
MNKSQGLFVTFMILLLLLMGFVWLEISRQRKRDLSRIPSGFVVREMSVEGSDEEHPVNVLEITGHGKRCYIYAGSAFYTRTTLWCEDLK